MPHSTIKAAVRWTVSVFLASVQAFSAAAALPRPDDSPPLPFKESLAPGTRIDAIVKSLVVGRWVIDSRDLGQKEDPQYRYRWVFHFSTDHAVEMRIWLKDGYAGSEGDPPVYFGLVQTGDWFIHKGRIGIISRQCRGLTAPAQLECDTEADEIGDTSYHILQRQKDGVFLSSGESAPVRFTFKGRDRDMSAPAFWPSVNWPALMGMKPACTGMPRPFDPGPGFNRASTGLQQDRVAECHVQGQMLLQAFPLLRRAPGPAEQSIDARPEHGAGVVQGEERIEAQLFQLPLVRQAGASSRIAMMDCLGEMPFHRRPIQWVLIGTEGGVVLDEEQHPLEEALESPGAGGWGAARISGGR